MKDSINKTSFTATYPFAEDIRNQTSEDTFSSSEVLEMKQKQKTKKSLAFVKLPLVSIVKSL
jgi:hypothetical protein